MSEEHDGSTELTPFEFALAGVSPPNGTKAPSLQAIRDMRALLEGTGHAPVGHAGLREFLDHGGPIDSRRRHRLGRSGATTTAGHFIDITPTELGQTGTDQAAEEHEVIGANGSVAARSTAEQPAGDVVDAAADAAPGTATDAGSRSEPAGNGPLAVGGLSAPLGGAPDEEVLSEEIAGVHAELQRLLREADEATGAPAATPMVSLTPLDTTDADRATNGAGGDADDPAAAIGADAIDETTGVEVTAISALPGDPGDDGAPLAPLPPPASESPTAPLEPRASADPTSSAPLSPDPISSDPPSSDPISPDLGSVTDRLRDTSGRFAAPATAADDATGGPADDGEAADQPPGAVDEPTGPVVETVGPVVGAAAVGGLLFDDTAATPASDVVDVGAAESDLFAGADASGSPSGQPDEPAREGIAVAAAPAGVGLLDESAAGPPMVGPPPAPTGLAAIGRPGAPILAAVGAAAAAAALIAGALWWTSGANQRTTSTDEVAAPSTAEATETATSEASDSRSTGATSGSTADGTSQAERFGSSSSTATSAPATTAEEATTLTSRPDSTADTTATVGVETTAGEATTTSDDPTTSSTDDPTSTTGSTAPPTSTTVTTVAPSTTAAPTTVTVPTTAAPTTAAPLAYIGDRVTIGNYDGEGLAGVRVTLWIDEDRNRTADRRVATASTGSDGRYSFDAEAGCYFVRFDPPEGYSIRAVFAEQYVCVGAGEAAARIDALADAEIVAAGPTGCEIEPDTGSVFDGVEVHENQRNWASSYVFYSRQGAVVARTSALGAHDHADNANEREWFGSGNGFDHRAVYTVTAIRDGVESAPVTCART